MTAVLKRLATEKHERVPLFLQSMVQNCQVEKDTEMKKIKQMGSQKNKQFT